MRDFLLAGPKKSRHWLSLKKSPRPRPLPYVRHSCHESIGEPMCRHCVFMVSSQYRHSVVMLRSRCRHHDYTVTTPWRHHDNTVMTLWRHREKMFVFLFKNNCRFLLEVLPFVVSQCVGTVSSWCRHSVVMVRSRCRHNYTHETYRVAISAKTWVACICTLYILTCDTLKRILCHKKA